MRYALIGTGTALAIAATFVLVANLVKRGIHEIATEPDPIPTDTVLGTVCPICLGDGIIHTTSALAFCGCPAGATAQTRAHAIEQNHPSTS